MKLLYTHCVYFMTVFGVHPNFTEEYGPSQPPTTVSPDWAMIRGTITIEIPAHESWESPVQSALVRFLSSHSQTVEQSVGLRDFSLSREPRVLTTQNNSNLLWCLSTLRDTPSVPVCSEVDRFSLIHLSDTSMTPLWLLFTNQDWPTLPPCPSLLLKYPYYRRRLVQELASYWSYNKPSLPYYLRGR